MEQLPPSADDAYSFEDPDYFEWTRQAEYEAYTVDAINEALRVSEFQSMIDGAIAIRPEIVARRQQVLCDKLRQDPSLNEDAIERIVQGMSVNYRAYEERMFLYVKMMLIIDAMHRPHTLEIETTIGERKLESIADFMFERHLGFNDPMIRFLREALPGGVVDERDVDPYIFSKVERLSDDAQTRLRRREAHEVAKDVSGLWLPAQDRPEIAFELDLLYRYHWYLSSAPFEEKLHEIAKELALDPGAVRVYIDTLIDQLSH